MIEIQICNFHCQNDEKHYAILMSVKPNSLNHMSRVMKKTQIFAYAKTKAQISFAVTAKLISAFVFATRIVQFLYFLNSISSL